MVSCMAFFLIKHNFYYIGQLGTYWVQFAIRKIKVTRNSSYVSRAQVLSGRPLLLIPNSSYVILAGFSNKKKFGNSAINSHPQWKHNQNTIAGCLYFDLQNIS